MEETLRSVVASRLVSYRKRAKLTQAELAEKLNYSDKSISKWERAAGLPDLYVLYRLSRLYGVPIDAFVEEGPLRRPARTQRHKHLIITLISIGVVWLLAAIAYFVCTLIPAATGGGWLAFIVALPVSAVISVVFSHLWSTPLLQGLSVSLLVWSLALTISLILWHLIDDALPLLYLIAGMMQVLVCLWYALVYLHKRTKGNILSLIRGKEKR